MARIQPENSRRSITHDGKPVIAFEINMIQTWNICIMRCQCGHRGPIESHAALDIVDKKHVVACHSCGGVGFAFFGGEV